MAPDDKITVSEYNRGRHESFQSYTRSVPPPKAPVIQFRLPFSHEEQVGLAVDGLISRDFINHVFAAEKNWLNRVRYWVEVLDIPEVTKNKTFHVYFPQNS